MSDHDGPTDRSLRIDVGDITLVWGDKAQEKAILRSESLDRHLEQPVAERLRAAFGARPAQAYRIMSGPQSELLGRISAVLRSHRIEDFAFTGGVAVAGLLPARPAMSTCAACCRSRK